mmetsp:Transcript_22222/g.41373  ORF Transcript_22222/g.41373 Transcript_22222/m.41373 type:complete len:500 (-) Transcript_22222:35-1534(-)
MLFISSPYLFLTAGLAFWAYFVDATLFDGSDDASKCQQWPAVHPESLEGLEMLQRRSHKVENVNARQPPLPQFSVEDCKLQNKSKGLFFHSTKELEDTCVSLLGKTLQGTTSFLQDSLTNTAARASTDDSSMSKQELLAELELARKNVATLESLLVTSDVRVNDVHRGRREVEDKQSPATISSSSPHVSTPAQRVAKLASLFILFVGLAAYIVQTIRHYQRERDEFDEPWFHNSECLTKVLASISFIWVIFGVYCFTEVALFTDAGRHLTTIEAVYVISQIITTIGYGELTPATQLGIIFMMFYSIIAVMLFGMKAQHFIMWYMEMSGDVDHVKDKSSTRILAPILACWMFGTLFYAYYPGENLTIAEGMYMSVITFLTIGFGDYHPETPFGRAIGAVWMVVGVVLTGIAILDFTKYLYHHRRNLRSQAAAAKAFDEIDKTHKGYIDKAQFLSFELVQEGLEQETIDKILAKFDEFDLENNGKLNFKEFKAYVDSMELM